MTDYGVDGNQTMNQFQEQKAKLKSDQDHYLQVLKYQQALNVQLHQELLELKAKHFELLSKAMSQQSVSVDYAILQEFEFLKGKIAQHKIEIERIADDPDVKEIRGKERLTSAETQTETLKNMMGNYNHRAGQEIPFFANLCLQELRIKYDTNNKQKEYLDLQKRQLQDYIVQLKKGIQQKVSKRNQIVKRIEQEKSQQ